MYWRWRTKKVYNTTRAIIIFHPPKDKALRSMLDFWVHTEGSFVPWSGNPNRPRPGVGKKTWLFDYFLLWMWWVDVDGRLVFFFRSWFLLLFVLGIHVGYILVRIPNPPGIHLRTCRPTKTKKVEATDVFCCFLFWARVGPASKKHRNHLS